MEEIDPRLLVQSLTLSDNALKLKTPFCLSISGPSQEKINCPNYEYKILLKSLEFKICNHSL